MGLSLIHISVERALYVDIDTIFNRDISSMYETEFGDCLIAGVFTTYALPSRLFSQRFFPRHSRFSWISGRYRLYFTNTDQTSGSISFR